MSATWARISCNLNGRTFSAQGDGSEVLRKFKAFLESELVDVEMELQPPKAIRNIARKVRRATSVKPPAIGK